MAARSVVRHAADPADGPAWADATPARPCPVCGATGGCAVAEESRFASDGTPAAYAGTGLECGDRPSSRQ